LSENQEYKREEGRKNPFILTKQLVLDYTFIIANNRMMKKPFKTSLVTIMIVIWASISAVATPLLSQGIKSANNNHRRGIC